jgi:hypothetical protein
MSAPAGSQRGWEPGVERVCWGLALATLLVIGWSVLCTVPGIPWNGARLAPSFALARGLPIYALRDSGAHLGWFYGPGLPLWYLPFGLLDNPTVAFVLAGLWNAVTLLAPIFLVVRRALGGKSGIAARLTLLGALLLLATKLTQGSFYMLHTDVVCVAFVLLSGLALHARALRGWRGGLPLAALAVALAVSTKQLAIIFVPATFMWLWREGYRGLLRAWLFWLLVCGGGVAGILFVAFGPEQLLFNAWLVQSHTPFQEGAISLLWSSLGALVANYWVWWVALVLGWLAVRRRSGGSVALPAEAGSLVRLLLWAAVWQAPFGVLASLKIGGGINSVHALSYLLVAGLIVAGALGSGAAQPASERKASEAEMGFSRVTIAVLLLGVGSASWLTATGEGVWTLYREQEKLVARVRAAPGTLYLPWNPVISIIAEKKVRPFDDALLCLWRARLEPPVEAIRAAIPPGAAIFYQEPSQSHFVLNYFGPEARAAADPKRTP